MTIRQKLRSILAAIAALGCVYAGSTIYVHLATEREVEGTLREATTTAHAMLRTRSAIHMQTIKSIEYLFGAKQKVREDFSLLGDKVNRRHAEWIKSLRTMAPSEKDAKPYLRRAHKIMDLYRINLALIADGFARADAGDLEGAYEILEEKAEYGINHQIREEVDEALNSELIEIAEAYDGILIRLGLMPWVSKEGVKQVKLARLSMQYMVDVDGIQAKVRLQFRELLDYLIAGEEIEKEGFRELGRHMIVGAVSWQDDIESYERMSRESMSASLERSAYFRDKYSEFLTLGEKVFELRDNGFSSKARRLVSSSVEPLVYDIFISVLDAEMTTAKKRIDSEHKRLAEVTFKACLLGIFAALGVTLFCLFVFFLIMRSILIPLKKLQKGTEVVSTGNFEHRIGLGRSDELGRLADSFDRMAEDLKESRDELIVSKEYNDNILRTMGVTLVVLCIDGKIKTVNSALCNLLDFCEEELIGQPAGMVLGGHFSDLDLIPADPKAIRTYEPWENKEIEYQTKSGVKVPVSFSSTLMVSDAGEAEGIVCVAKDISERKRAEMTLRKSERRFKELSQEFNALLDAIPDCLILLTPKLEILWANKAAAAAVGKPVSEMEGERCFAVYGRVAPCRNCPVLACFESGVQTDGQFTTSEGKFLDIRAFPVKSEDGAVDSVIEVSIDITEKSNLQAEAMQAAHLAALGEMAAGVAHEINNPINSVINYAQIIIDEFNGSHPSAEMAKRILGDGDRVAKIVTSLLSFSRSDNNYVLPCRVDDLLSTVLTLTNSQMRKDDINLIVNCPSDLPLITANPQQVEQVFLNIINNARYALNQKYSQGDRDKVLKITAEEKQLGAKKIISLVFLDNGTGIPKEIMNKVFNPFFTTKPKPVGTGLGLGLSRRIAADHGGAIYIESVNEQFTKVTVELPVGEGSNG